MEDRPVFARRIALLVQRNLELRGPENYGRHAPLEALGRVMIAIPRAIARSARMAFVGRSRSFGRLPDWLKATSDARFFACTGERETILELELPTLAAAAPAIYGRPDPWPNCPDPDRTGFDLLVEVLDDVASGKRDSDRFDDALLKSIVGLQSILKGPFDELRLTSPAGTRCGARSVSVTERTFAAAQEMYSETPAPRPAQIVGTLDMVRASTSSFELILDDGQAVQGVLTEGDFEAAASHLGRRVMAFGHAVFRPTGKLLRLDARAISPQPTGGDFFSALPQPIPLNLTLAELSRRALKKPGVAGLFGKWPGNETDEEIAAALEEMS